MSRDPLLEMDMLVDRVTRGDGPPGVWLTGLERRWDESLHAYRRHPTFRVPAGRRQVSYLEVFHLL